MEMAEGGRWRGMVIAKDRSDQHCVLFSHIRRMSADGARGNDCPFVTLIREEERVLSLRTPSITDHAVVCLVPRLPVPPWRLGSAYIWEPNARPSPESRPVSRDRTF